MKGVLIGLWIAVTIINTMALNWPAAIADAYIIFLLAKYYEY